MSTRASLKLVTNPHITMKVEGLKGCFEKTRGVFYFARMCSKIRLHAEGKLPKDYHEELGQGFDGRTCRYLGSTIHALRRIESGSYGICEMSGEPIPISRL